MSEEVTRNIPEHILDGIYVDLLDYWGRYGNHSTRRCLNFLENEHGYKPPVAPEQ